MVIHEQIRLSDFTEFQLPKENFHSLLVDKSIYQKHSSVYKKVLMQINDVNLEQYKEVCDEVLVFYKTLVSAL
jgi:hypothetical protein